MLWYNVSHKGKNKMIFRRKIYDRLLDTCYTKDVMVKNGIRHLPLYMAMFM